MLLLCAGPPTYQSL